MTTRDEIKAGDLATLKNLDMVKVLEVNDGICQVLCWGERLQVACYELSPVR